MKFIENPYFPESELKVIFHMPKPDNCDKIEGTAIAWNSGCNPSIEKKKKKKKGKKGQKSMGEKKVLSFFDLFDTIEENVAGQSVKEHQAATDKMIRLLELSNNLRDRVIPLAFETYLGVMEQKQVEAEDYNEGFSDEDSDDNKGKPLGGKGGNKGPGHNHGDNWAGPMGGKKLNMK